MDNPAPKPLLKRIEPEVDSSYPWADDLLGRREIGDWLTSLVANQEPPLTISLHGQWGTGKTFLLKRWQCALEKDGYRAIYFNAWEDDFSDDPLLAILGQLTYVFKGSRLQEIAERIFENAIPLGLSNVSSVLRHFTGLTVEHDARIGTARNLLKKYREQRDVQDVLKKEIENLATEVYQDTNQPLIFIIDELDRCRPTFAIELLERVKHLFDVKHMAFVFGLNRDELSKSLSSIYGNINVDVYLRRFFDFEFNIPQIDSQEFTKHLMATLGLKQAFEAIFEPAPGGLYDYRQHKDIFSKFWSALGISLRDIDYSVRLLALFARNYNFRKPVHLYLAGFVTVMKFKSPEYYRAMIAGGFRTSEVMDYTQEALGSIANDEDIARYLDRVEAFLYCADSANQSGQECGQAALDELSKWKNDVEFEYMVISNRVRYVRRTRIEYIITSIMAGRSMGINSMGFGGLAELIDTYQSRLRY